MSHDCAAALAKEALAWLDAQVLLRLVSVLDNERLPASCSPQSATVPEAAATALSELLFFLAEFLRRVRKLPLIEIHVLPGEALPASVVTCVCPTRILPLVL